MFACVAVLCNAEVVDLFVRENASLMFDRLPSFQLLVEPVTRDGYNLAQFDPAVHGEKIGKRHRLGGVPDWIREPEWPFCENCRRQMTFYAQLDGLSPEIPLGNNGLIFIFFCFDCCEVKSVFQTE
jgi:hypothetical protein